MNDRFFKTYPEMKTQYFGFLTNLRQVHTFWCVEKGHAQSTAVPCLARMSCGWVPGCRATPRESCSASRRSSTGSTVRWVTPANHVLLFALLAWSCNVLCEDWGERNWLKIPEIWPFELDCGGTTILASSFFLSQSIVFQVLWQTATS